MINITGHTGLTGLLGSPVAHSVSPLMHNEAFRYLGLDYVYLCFDVTEETLPQAVEGLKACGIKGFNLTMPNKNKIVELLDELSPTAQLIGAVNTVRNDNGKLKGFNTDGYGFTLWVWAVPEWQSADSPPWRVQKRSMFLHVLPAVTGNVPLPWQKKCLI